MKQLWINQFFVLHLKYKSTFIFIIMSNYIQVSNQKILEIIEAHPTSPIINQ